MNNDEILMVARAKLDAIKSYLTALDCSDEQDQVLITQLYHMLFPKENKRVPTNWRVETPSEEDTKQYYCQICNKNIDTKDVKRESLGSPATEYQFCPTCHIRLTVL
jgi:Pyruvate/2-oxoacid:ferredoxin oxidoreductase delta subunit